MKIGVICPSEIANRRFMPALEKIDGVEFAGVGVCSRQERQGLEKESDKTFECIKKEQYKRALVFVDKYGGDIFDSYEEVVTSDKIDAVYIPLPPALHYRWAKVALEHGRHVLLEKPFTTSVSDTMSLVDISEKNNLAVHENYMFMFHSQLDFIDKIIDSGEIGDVRLFRISFGFPMRDSNDFRYKKELGGGALLDAGGYTIKYATRLLGDSAKVVQAKLNGLHPFDVDIYGSGVMVNDNGCVAHLAFGMDNDYKCELEVWGSKGTIYTNRVLTAPSDYKPEIIISKNGCKERVELAPDDTFKKSIKEFLKCISSQNARRDNIKAILKQARHVEEFQKLSQ